VRLRRALALALVVALCSTCTVARVSESALGGGDLSVEKENEITADIARQIRRGAPLIGDPILLSYLNELGQEIVASTEPQPFVYRFALIRDDALNAFTIGGGYVYLHSGVLAQVGDVSELAGVLAHEIAHVRLRHIAERSEGQGVATLATLAAMAAIALAGADPALVALPQGINVALQLQHSRRAEAEADRGGIEYLIRAGHDPNGMMRFFERILAKDPGRRNQPVPPYLYSHPALEERIAAARLQIARLNPPAGLVRSDARLAEMQARLAAILEPVAGGSGLLARPEFDRSASDPRLEQAAKARTAGDLVRADALLAEAQEKQPFDPRVPLARADLAEEREDLDDAARHLDRAFELNPSVPLIQHRLGLVHQRLGQRTRAVFYLEQAVANYRPGSASRHRAELDLELIFFPMFDSSALLAGGELRRRAVFVAGEEIRWSAQLARRYLERNPRLEVRWRGPGGQVVKSETLRMGPLGGLSSTLQTRGLPPGAWTLEVAVGENPLEQQRFELVAHAVER
jgi:predicted Zn-dependent protease